jgi:hypothetical protein
VVAGKKKVEDAEFFVGRTSTTEEKEMPMSSQLEITGIEMKRMKCAWGRNWMGAPEQQRQSPTVGICISPKCPTCMLWENNIWLS